MGVLGGNLRYQQTRVQRARAKGVWRLQLSFRTVEFSNWCFPFSSRRQCQERCHFSSPTKRQIINVGVDVQLPEDVRGGRTKV
jgi:hypothetical protein